MATPVVFNAVNYSVPAFGDVGYAQGPGNLSAYLIAIATGTLQPTGGLFSLTADLDFGPNFGIKSLYYKTQSTPLATTGVFRMARTDFLAWRDQANANDLELGVNALDQLTYNGVAISSSGGALIGTTLTLTATSNQMIIGTGTTTTVTFTAPAASAVYTVPDVGTTASFVMTAGTQSIAGAKTFTTSPLNLTQAFNGTTSITIANSNVGTAAAAALNVDNGSTSTTLVMEGTGNTGSLLGFTISNYGILRTGSASAGLMLVSGNGNVYIGATDTKVMTIDASTNVTVVGSVIAQRTTNQLVLGITRTVTINAPTPATLSRTHTIPDVGTNANFVLDQGAYTITGAWIFSSAVRFPAGSVGTPSINFSDVSTGFYKLTTNQIGVSLNGIRAVAFNSVGTSYGTLYEPITISGGGGSSANALSIFTATSVSTSPVQVAQINEGAILALVYGADGASNDFFDIVATGLNTDTPFVVMSQTSRGTPTARTYAKSSTLNMTLAMASGTYSVRSFSMDVGAFF